MTAAIRPQRPNVRNHRKVYCCAVLLCLAPLVGCESKHNPPESAAGPKLLIDNPEQYCKMQLPGDSHVFKFELANQGNEVLKILEVKKSCGCISLDLPSRELLPGAGLQLSVEASQDRYGVTSQWAILRTNEQPDRALHKIVVNMEITPRFVCTPSRISEKLYCGQKIQRTIQIASHVDAQITAVEKSADWIKSVAYQATPDHHIIVNLSAESLNPGEYDGSIVISTNFKDLSRVSVPVHLKVASELSVIPDFLFLGTIEPNQPPKPRFVEVSVFGKAPQNVNVTVTPENLLSCRLVQEPNGTRIYVAVDDRYAGQVDGQLRLRIEPSNREVLVPVKGYVSRRMP